MKTTLSTLFCLLLFGFGGQAQNKLQKADMHFNDFEFPKAIELYKAVADRSNNPDQYVVKQLAESYFNIADYNNARVWYQKLYEDKGQTMNEGTFIKYIQSLKASQEYEKANELIQSFYSKNPHKLKLIADQMRHLDSINMGEPAFSVQGLDSNSPKADFGPMYYKDNQLVFASSRDTVSGMSKLHEWNQQPYLDLYVAQRDQFNGDLYEPKKFLDNMESDFHDAAITFSSDYKTAYFSHNYYKKGRLKVNNDGVSTIMIMKGTLEGDNIAQTLSMSFNDQSYSCTHPFLTKDGKYLFFVSDMPGGYGSSDIYVAKVLDHGTTGTPVNLGPMVNTRGREMFPYMINDTLYFASDAHFGMGGLDIFEAPMSGDVEHYMMPQNLGAPVNSNRDDFAFIIDPETNTGYFSSNRAGGEGDDDIYFFKRQKVVKTFVYSGHVLEQDTEKPLPGTQITLYDMFNKPVKEMMSGTGGYYEFPLTAGDKYHIVFKKDSYGQKNVSVEFPEAPPGDSKNNDIHLVPFKSLIVQEGDVEKIKVNPIYFDFDKYDITPRAVTELEKVVFAMTQFPDIRIKIESHTDSRGSDPYNLKLSDQRAKSTRDYIISRGIAADRIQSAIGYGETRLKNHCSNGVKCDEDEHLTNRRSDFIIIEKAATTQVTN